MQEELYKIVFKGEIGFDFDEEEVKEGLQKFCGFDRDTVDRLFSGKTIVLKKNLDETKAHSLCSALQKLGALAMVAPMEPMANTARSFADDVSVTSSIEETTSFVCPACGLKQDKGESCIVCGIVFAKFVRAQQRRAQELLAPPPYESSVTTETTAGSKLMSFFGQVAAQPFAVQCSLLILALGCLQAILGPALLSIGFIILPVLYFLCIMVRGILTEQEAMASIAEHFNVFWERVEPEECRRQWIPWGTYGVVLLNVALYYGLVLHLDPAFIRTHLAFVPAEPNLWNVPLSAIVSMFLHASGWQLWGCVMFFWAVGPMVEKRLGYQRFLGFYLLSGLVAGGVGALLYPLLPQGALHGLGSSGAIAGIIGISIASSDNRSLEFAPPVLDLLQYLISLRLIIRLDSLAFTGLFFFASLGAGIGPQVALVAVLIGHLIHAAGMLAGLAVGQMFRSENLQNNGMKVENGIA